MTGGWSAPPDGWGIVPAYEDAFGNRREVPDEVRARLIEAMGGDPADDGPPPATDVHVTRRGAELPVDSGEVRYEHGGGATIAGRVPLDAPFGYHDLLVAGEDQARTLIVSPGTCWLPDDLHTWGWALQLYAVRSRDSWGIGDLADLRRVGGWSAGEGAGTILVNPLNAVNPTEPRETSPYFPSTRRWLDPVYLSIDEIPGASEIPEVSWLAARGRASNADRTIDRDAVYDRKIAALEAIWRRQRGRAEPDFDGFLREHGSELTRFATFLVIAERLGCGWRRWPAEYRRPDATAVERLADEEADRVRFHAWVQWQLDRQLRDAGQQIALLRDLPVGADPDGVDAWEWQDLLADGVTVGAPPDELGPQGQNWTLPAFVPWKLRAAGYAPFAEVLRAGFRHAAGLRIDHVLGLFRVFWIPPGGSPAEGTYVRQPAEELLDIVALESQRANALVVGEDLGTVEEGVRPTLRERDMLRYQVWWFEDDPVDQWDELALASVSTHDLPTVAGAWTGADEELQRRAGLDPDADWFEQLRDRIAKRTGIARDASAETAVVAVHRLLARAPNRIVLAQLEDAIAAEDRINIPGTGREQHANWSRALASRFDELIDDDTLAAVADAVAAGRRSSAS
ncbi:MAG: 4-alpha-glucanotransferase [Nitriliruptorales bacterium]|nr:4-alpha-glucanotransferase [Nitriliruptorales bacterium]